MSLDLTKCTSDCQECLVSYIKKHRLSKGDQFEISCKGIPKKYIPDHILQSLDADPRAAIAIYDPVTWAELFLDWHCLDPEGKVWERKTKEGTLPAGVVQWDEEIVKKRKSPFHRPYQSTVLRCTSKRKVLRMGRQTGKSESLCILMLHAAFTNQGYKVLLLAPQESQIEALFSRLNDFVKSNDVLANSVVRNTRKPYELGLTNGSRIRAFTAGTKSGHKAGSVRGQDVNFLVGDEVDYMSDGDIETALATIANFPDAPVIMSSTPSGARAKFYYTCHDLMYKEHYYPSWANPNWSEDLEKFFKSQYTEVGYDHEVKALFGEQEQGVYQNRYILAAMSPYEYHHIVPRKDWIYMIGVDWNDTKIGTNIAVVGYNPFDFKFYFVERETINKLELTQLVACNRIAELNRKWLPINIYVDKGFASAQIEVLRQMGHKARRAGNGNKDPDSRLLDIVKPFDFGSNLEIHDPITKQPVKKWAKPFLVDNSVLKFETYSVCFPKSDKDIAAQLENYIIDRVNDSGRPIYRPRDEKIGDHMLDAFNLALVAFTIERSELSRPRYDAAVSFVSSSIEGNKDPSSYINNARESKPPVQNRASELIEKSPSLLKPKNSLPLANSTLTSETNNIWSHPGFLRDEPMFNARQTRINRFKSRKGSRPKRSNI